ncbi:NADP-dependent oxidoreductase [Nonomuraea muscovyensis]|uniref:NADPH:quinone reductase-like Zn-dependent oxidoreductase n=1 Tax=Nonomuraea muscovyensis TaxID=1124761 RepID=A0A7X0C1R4_9ACTN|nr:NADP-dependent oxidoreductase [Nonomuraea muscovyensis]MBB6346126.1 NADPH:quinone reductase-like Zn-dependent oxidoreductase [Nonomuraea muscovyensis]
MAFTDFGADLAATDLPVPEPGPDEVLVRVLASSVNGFDLGVLGGYLKGSYDYEFPVVLGKDFAGTVTAVGADVTGWTPGEDVFGVVMRPTLGQGGFAEYVAVSAGYGLAKIPGGLGHTRAAALGLAGTAALNAVDAVAPAPGETVLISGATGGVGSFAVQLAAARGARVIATARPGAETAFVTGLGATWAVDHTDLSGDVRAIAPGGVDAALHLAGDGPAVAALLADGGRLASTLHYTVDEPGRDIKATAVMADPNPDTLARLAADAAEGRLRVPVARSYPLAEAARALADFTTGTVGKLAITI